MRLPRGLHTDAKTVQILAGPLLQRNEIEHERVLHDARHSPARSQVKCVRLRPDGLMGFLAGYPGQPEYGHT